MDFAHADNRHDFCWNALTLDYNPGLIRAMARKADSSWVMMT